MEIIFILPQGEYSITVTRREGTQIAVSEEYKLPPDRIFSRVKDFKEELQKTARKGKKCSNCGQNGVYEIT